MTILPAIDLRGGKCVRLFQGDLDRETVYGDDPAAMAARWEAEGAEWLHVVDLDGAVTGRPAHLDALRAITRRVQIPVEFGGGVRTIEDARAVFAAGAWRLVLGTAALEDPELLAAVSSEFPACVFVALDARDGKVMVRGWKEASGRDVLEAARECEGRGAGGFLFTDISRDGAETGVNVEATARLADAVTLPVIASGGVASLDDVKRVRAIADRGVSALVIGRALYTGTVRLSEAIAAAR